MRHINRILSGSLSALAILASASFADAQLDVNPPLPNVLLLIDSSGSMELMASGQPAEQSGATCIPGTATPLNRWATLLTVLTGTISNFSCYAQDRASTNFYNEYVHPGSVNPVDYKYYLPFHRVLSNGCAYGPGTLGANWWDFPSNAIKSHPWDNAAGTCTTPFDQANDGLLDVYSDRVRFGLMTFDSNPNAGTGLSNGSPSYGTGTAGNWSYYLDWNNAGAAANGNPPNCTASDFEVGARNPAAPPWEGRMIGFGGSNATTAEVQQVNTRIQSALLALRPYGATPLAGMMADAKTFLRQDLSKDPANAAENFGPATDPYYVGGCRTQYIIVLSDGEPNLDLRDACASGNGKCPYSRPHEIAHELATLSNPIKTFAVGFGLSQANGQDCSQLTTTQLLDANGICATATGSLKACCTLARLAYEGGTQKAYFANDLPTLKAALDSVLSIVASGSTTRTFPTFAGAGTAQAQGSATAAGYQFNTSFNVALGTLWTGNLERKRYVCQNQNGILKPVLTPLDASKGDDFDANVNTNNPIRKFFTVIGADSSGFIRSKRSIRPSLTIDDGLGLYGGTVTGLQDGISTAATLGAKPAALEIPTTPIPDQCKTIAGANTTASNCANVAIQWETGLPGVPSPRTGKAFGSIYHASPVLVGTPNGYLRDESYAAFAADPAIKKRALMMYAATTDGQLHGMKVASNDTTDLLPVDALRNNELWSFIPPYVLPGILPTYGRQALLLDGSLVTKDVVFERTRAQAQGGALGVNWRSVVLGSGGSGGGFYYAMDVTNPSSPQFLWQLSTNTAGDPLFGSKTIKPTIATIALDDGNQDVREVAVAILPGGGTSLTTGTCNRLTAGSAVWSLDSFQPKLGVNSVRCWQDATGKVGPARSLTIVRLDNGQVIMNFRGASVDGPTLPATKFKANVFDSPITGVPVAYPSQTGQVSDRIYVGDADGVVWRIDMRDPKPVNWGVDLVWDAYSMPGDTPAIRQTIETPVIPTIDAIGNPVVLFTTGDQETFTKSANVRTRVWSFNETRTNGTLVTKSNWVIPLENGVRVTGPIALFNGAAYFSTFTPTGTPINSCAEGYGSIWGVDYLKKTGCAANAPTPPTNWPCARYVQDPVNNPGVVSFFEDQAPGAQVFGVSVAQTPNCYESVTYPDPYLGSITSVGNSTAGEFQLFYQTGNSNGANSGGSNTTSVSKPLPPPRTSVRVDSWGLVLE
jgi:type IV pilus assembly protein PilY1